MATIIGTPAAAMLTKAVLVGTCSLSCSRSLRLASLACWKIIIASRHTTILSNRVSKTTNKLIKTNNRTIRRNTDRPLIPRFITLGFFFQKSLRPVSSSFHVSSMLFIISAKPVKRVDRIQEVRPEVASRLW